MKHDTVVEQMASLAAARDRGPALNGLTHGLVSKDPEVALKWANLISDEEFRKTMVETVT